MDITDTYKQMNTSMDITDTYKQINTLEITNAYKQIKTWKDTTDIINQSINQFFPSSNNIHQRYI